MKGERVLKQRKRLLGLVQIVAALALASAFVACGDSHDTSSGGGGATTSGHGATTGATQKTSRVSIGLAPFVDSAPVYVGVKQGFFKQEGLDVKPVVQPSGAVLLPAVVKGTLQFGLGNPVSVLLASAHGLPVKVLDDDGVSAPALKDSWSPLMVPKGSSIASPRDLAGKTVGINAVSSLAEIVAREALAKRGVDAGSVKFVEVPVPDMIAAMESHRVDAVFLGEPFSTIGRLSGHKVLMDPFTEVAPKMPISILFSTARYSKESSDVVQRFVRAFDKSLAYCASHPEAVRGAIPQFTQTPAKIAARMNLPTFQPGLDVGKLDLIANLMVKYKLLDHKPDVQAVTGR
jgi:NitT/TauT family transport system substrate-binding protein